MNSCGSVACHGVWQWQVRCECNQSSPYPVRGKSRQLNLNTFKQPKQFFDQRIENVVDSQDTWLMGSRYNTCNEDIFWLKP